MDTVESISKIKRLLCISPRGAQHGKDLCGDLPHWDVCIVGTLTDAAKVLNEQHFPVGLLLDCIGERSAVSLNAADVNSFLLAHGRTQWIGVVERRSLQVPECRAIMAHHLCDFHTTPVDRGKLLHTIGHVHGWACLREHPAAPLANGQRHHLTGDSVAIGRLRKQIFRVASVSAPVLICGESGSGKELVAKAVHAESPFAQGPFVAINCGAIPANLIQSELFGHERGAFTGAAREKKGLIESAQDGTIFLDEIAEMPLELQVNLLRFLQEKTIYRVGSNRSIVVNARVIAASHVDLQTAVAQGRFREDLYYRMNVLPITVPPLRERRADLPALVDEFFHAYGSEKNPQLKGVSSSAMEAILAHPWPGNVRELMNRIRRAMVLAEGRLISVEDLGLHGPASVAPDGVPAAAALTVSRAEAERQVIAACLARARGNVSQAARELKVSRMTLYRLMDKHHISIDPVLRTQPSHGRL